MKEKAASTLGYMCLHSIMYLSSEPEQLDLNKLIMQKLFESSQAKQIELHMAIGEALVNCALGSRSNDTLNPWLNAAESSEGKMEVENVESQDQNLVWLLEELLKTYIPNPNQHLRQAACFWLLTLVKKSARKSDILSGKNPYLYRVQDAFIQRLGEADDTTQEVASKAIGVIFSIADEEQKKILVSRLTETISGGSKKKTADSALKITNENEEIFQPEQIGRT